VVFVTKLDNEGNRTLEHEIGHALGLRHTSEYTVGSPLKADEADRAMEFGGKGHKFTGPECEVIMRNINDFLKDF
jgi:hypothetical protein